MPAGGQAAARSSGGGGGGDGGVQGGPGLAHRQHSIALRNNPGLHWFWKFQHPVFKFYHEPRVQYVVAGFILSNFVVECVQRQIDPDPNDKQYEVVWTVLEKIFSSVFLIELIINMYGSWFKLFFSIGWNYFDMLVVAVGMLILFDVKLPGVMSKILMLRAFRVFRLFGRIGSLRKILLSLKKAIPGVTNAYIIMALVVCIYAVLAVDLFKDAYKDSPNARGAVSMRGEIYGEEYYGTFFKALYTLFQILTGESWSEAGVRPLLWEPKAGPGTVVITALFFLSFIFINAIVLLNVVVAVLLDGMSSAGDQVDSEAHPEDGESPEEDGADGKEKKQEPELEPEAKARKDLAIVKVQLSEMSMDMDQLLAAIRARGTK